MTLQAGNYVGIGTTSPSSNFQVVQGGTANLGNGLYTQLNSMGQTAASLLAGYNTGSGPTLSGGEYTWTIGGGDTNGAITNTPPFVPGGTYLITWNVRSTSAGVTFNFENPSFNSLYASPTLTSSYQNLSFYVTIPSNGQALTNYRVYGGSTKNIIWNAYSVQRLDTLVTGNLGVGTTSPQTPLGVYSGVAYNAGGVIGNAISVGTNLGNSLARPKIDTASANTSIWAYNFASPAGDDGFLRIAAGGGSTATAKAYIDVSGYSTLADMNNTVVLGTLGVERMRVDVNGRVGIGTTSPSAPLHTYFANSGIPDTTGSGTSNVAVRFNVGSVVLDIGNIFNGNMWLQNHLNTNWATNYPLLLNPNGGNIGIGTTSPPVILTIPCNSNGPIGNDPTAIDLKNGNVDVLIGTNASTNSGQIQVTSGGTSSTLGGTPYVLFLQPRGGQVAIGTTVNQSANLHVQGTCTVTGALSKGSGTFDIEHPLIGDTTRLCHSFIEGPRCDLLYRGAVQLVNGAATVNIDSDCTSNTLHAMTQGTFEALCTNAMCYLQNNETFDRVRGSIDRNILTIVCENTESTAVINWMVVAERKDPLVREWERTDADGFLIPEYEHKINTL